MTQLSRTLEPTAPDSELVIVPHTSSDYDIPSTPNPSTQKVVTDFWVEKCLHKKKFVDPTTSITNVPFKFPITGNLAPLVQNIFSRGL